MKIIKRILFILLVLIVAAGVSFYAYINTLPSAPPAFIDSAEVTDQAANAFQCNQGQVLQDAYQVSVKIESVLNGQSIYTSDLHFKTQLEQANGNIIKGIASNIYIEEISGSQTNQQKTIKDTYFLSRMEANPYALFSAFNHLGLADKHPMKILGQLLKNLSVGNDHDNYHFAYDSLQRTYRYQHNNQHITRDGQATTANFNQLANTLQSQAQPSLWQVELGSNCLPKTLSSEEYQGIAAAGHSGYIKFTINARRIPTFSDLSNIEFSNFMNSTNLWHSQEIASSKFESDITQSDEMWEILNGFSDSKNTAKLAKAIEFLIENSSASDLSALLKESAFDDNLKRDIAFGLSLSNHEDAERFIIDTLTDLNEASLVSSTQGGISASAQNDLDLQQVRLMVALSGSGRITEQGVQVLNTLSQDTQQNHNIQNNALINAASSVQQLQNQGQSSVALEEQLTENLSQALSRDNSASAILAAGNSDAINLDDQILGKLSSGNNKERYAAASVLARNSLHNDDLIQHLATESSDLVSYAILSNFDRTSLTTQQKDKLQDVANNANTDIQTVIEQLIQ